MHQKSFRADILNSHIPTLAKIPNIYKKQCQISTEKGKKSNESKLKQLGSLQREAGTLKKNFFLTS